MQQGPPPKAKSPPAPEPVSKEAIRSKTIADAVEDLDNWLATDSAREAMNPAPKKAPPHSRTEAEIMEAKHAKRQRHSEPIGE